MATSPHGTELAAYHELKEDAREVGEGAEEEEEEDEEFGRCDGGGTSEQRNA